jgi:hypothetical protein
MPISRRKQLNALSSRNARKDLTSLKSSSHQTCMLQSDSGEPFLFSVSLHDFSTYSALWKESFPWRIPSSEMLHSVALLRTDVSEEPSHSIIRVSRICELETLAINISSQRLSVASYGYRCAYFIDSFHPDGEGSRFLRNVGSYKSHTA